MAQLVKAFGVFTRISFNSHQIIDLVFFPATIIFFITMFFIRTKELKRYQEGSVYGYSLTARARNLYLQNLSEVEIDCLCIDNLFSALTKEPSIFLRFAALHQSYKYAKDVFIEYTLAAFKFPKKASVLQYFRNSANRRLDNMIACC